MSTKIGDMAVYISANTYGLARDLSKASGMVAGFASNVSRAMADIARPLTSFARDVSVVGFGNLMADGIRSAAGAMKEFVGDSLKLAAAAEVAQMRFSTMLGSNSKAKALIADLRELAAVSPLSTKDAQQYAGSLLGVGIRQEQISPTLARLSDIAPDREAMAGLVRAYGQIKGMGKLTGSDWLQIANTGTLTVEDLAKATFNDRTKTLGVDVDEFARLREQGRITFTDLQRAIKMTTDEGGRFYKMGERYSQTYAGKIDKLTDSWEELKRYFGEMVIDEFGLKGAADDAAKFTDKMKPLVDILRPVVRWVGELARGLAQLAAEGGKGFLIGGSVFLDKLGTHFPKTVAALRDTIGAMKDFRLNPESAARFGEWAADAIAGALKSVRPYWDSFINDFVMPLKEALLLIPNALKALDRSYTFVKDTVSEFGTSTKKLAQGLGNLGDGKKGLGGAVLDLGLIPHKMAWEDIKRASMNDTLKEMDALQGQYGLNDKDTSALWGALQELDRVKGAEAAAAERLKAAGSWWADAAAARPDLLNKAAARRAKLEDEIAGYTGGKMATQGAAKYLEQAKIDDIHRAALSTVNLSLDLMRRLQGAGGKEEYTFEKPKLEPRLAELAGRLQDRFIDPLAKFAEDLKDLDAIKGAGKISGDMHALAVGELVKDLGQYAGISGPPQLAAASELGSSQLATMTAMAGVGNNAQDMKGLLESIRQLQEQQLAEARRIAANTGQQPQVVTFPR